MRAIVIAGLLAAVAIAGGTALAQGSGGGGGGRDKGKAPPRPPAPIMRCADLAIGDYAVGALAPNATPLAPGEVSVRYEVRNAGGAAYVAQDAAQQWLSLEYTTPGGPQQVYQAPLPPPAEFAAPASTTSDGGRPGSVSLGPGQSWRGYLRAVVPAEAARRPLRIRLTYAPRRGPVQDCDMDNNTASIQR
ncbi:hypothetical protein U91I_01617 [alpha proteobacterium U9-1i]|nr:hypothetical protein U91I_01617 [alpha proteobacterium U9-1i]